MYSSGGLVSDTRKGGTGIPMYIGTSPSASLLEFTRRGGPVPRFRSNIRRVADGMATRTAGVAMVMDRN